MSGYVMVWPGANQGHLPRNASLLISLMSKPRRPKNAMVPNPDTPGTHPHRAPPNSQIPPDSLHRPHDAIGSVEAQISFHNGDIRRPEGVPVSRLQAEPLSEVFLYLVESGLRGNSRFAHGTFNFLQVCRYWNEVVIGSSRLWGFWVAYASKAWPLFNSRSSDGPLHLTWRCEPSDDAVDVLMDPKIPSRIRHLDFSGDDDELEDFLWIFDSNPPSNASSIRLQIASYDDYEPEERFARFLSSPFPKLSKLNLGSFLPSPSSPIFTTSKLTSLKLFLSTYQKGRYTLVQFSQILQHHPNLQELDLNDGAIPLPGTSEAQVPPRLINLRLHGTDVAILGFIDSIRMSSPLHNVVIHIDHVRRFTIPALASTVKKILAAYYDCRGLDYPRKIDSLTISSPPRGPRLVFDARSRSPPTSNLELQVASIGKLECEKVVEKTFDLFPSNDTSELTINVLPLSRRMLEKVKGLSHLRLSNQGSDVVEQTLDSLSLSSSNRGMFAGHTMRAPNHTRTRIGEPRQHLVPRLESLTIYRTGLCGGEWQLLDIVKERHEHNLGLKKLAVLSCWIDEFEDEPKLREVVNELEWDDNTVGEEEPDEDELEEESGGSDYDSDADLCEQRVHVVF